MPKRYRQTARDRFLSKHVHEWIQIDVYRIAIPIFTSLETCTAVMAYDDLDWDVPTVPFQGMAGTAMTATGAPLFFAILPPESRQGIWAHEASHLVDFIIDHLGLDPGIEGTEARAYLLEHIYTSIEAAMLPLQLPAVLTQPAYNEKPI